MRLLAAVQNNDNGDKIPYVLLYFILLSFYGPLQCPVGVGMCAVCLCVDDNF